MLNITQLNAIKDVLRNEHKVNFSEQMPYEQFMSRVKLLPKASLKIVKKQHVISWRQTNPETKKSYNHTCFIEIEPTYLILRGSQVSKSIFINWVCSDEPWKALLIKGTKEILPLDVQILNI